MGQREAAKKTREKFGLNTFAHTTLGRAFKALEQSILKASGDTPPPSNGPDIPKQAKAGSPDAPMDKMQKDTKFPSTSDTLERRGRLAEFLGGVHEEKDLAKVAQACREIVKRWYDRHRQLLL